MEDTYKTLDSNSEGLYKEKGSKFIAYAYPVTSEEQIKEIVAGLKKEYYDARHHCFAFRLGSDGKRYRANDDGEPSGSAGKPIYGQLLSYELTNVLVVVIRYFGGTKLGVPGLIRAYREATVDAIESNTIIEKTVDVIFNIEFDYLVMNDVMKIIKDLNPNIESQSYEMLCTMRLSIRMSEYDQLINRLKKVTSLRVLDEDE
ncbi:MAG: YigZ family protein [Bacteroidales bacterium]|jgi:uncharacterized YigZ family protein|nr:YigZ family protein [Bacteroidales bacterium]